jgi:hypothetical protein
LVSSTVAEELQNNGPGPAHQKMSEDGAETKVLASDEDGCPSSLITQFSSCFGRRERAIAVRRCWRCPWLRSLMAAFLR